MNKKLITLGLLSVIIIAGVSGGIFLYIYLNPPSDEDGNRPPSIINSSPSNNTPNKNQNEYKEFSVEVSDPDDDIISYEWYVNETKQNINNSRFLFKMNYYPGVYKIEVSCTDGKYVVGRNWTVTILQAPIYVRIYVNSTIHSRIETEIPEISQYAQDTINQGFRSDLISWSDNNVTELRNNLTYYYNNYDNLSMRLFGAVLIGDMPYAMANDTSMAPNPTVYPIDLYLMDLDGVWNDEGADGYFDWPSDKFGNNLTEIFIARINPNPLNNMNNLTALRDYFQRNHGYRNGTLTRPHSALLYIDDSWSYLEPAWTNSFTAYTNITGISDDYMTNRIDYLNRLTQIYEWVHLFAHSDYNTHYFDIPSSPQEQVSNTDILNSDTKALFYNLYCCYACNYIQTNNLGTQYLFSNNSLTVLGSARSGGIDLYQTFYDGLKDGKFIGEAFRLWFHNPEIDNISNKRRDISGTTILGDPLLSIL